MLLALIAALRLIVPSGAAASVGGLISYADVDANGFTTNHFLDGLGREVRVTDPLGFSVETYWDGKDRRAARDRRNYVTQFDYDAADRPSEERDFAPGAPGNGTLNFRLRTTYEDDVAGVAVVHTFDRRGTESKQEQDGLGRTERTTHDVGGIDAVERSFFDGNGNRTQVVDANGKIVNDAFDGANRKIQETRAPGTSDQSIVNYTYDAASRLIEQSNPRTGIYAVRQKYDDLDRLVRTEVPFGDGTGAPAVTSTAFDEAGNRVCEMQPLGGDPLPGGAAGLTVAQVQSTVCAGSYVTRWAWDEEQKLLSVLDANGGTTSFVYDADRNLRAQQDANTHLTTYEFDPRNFRTVEHRFMDASFARFGAMAARSSQLPSPSAGTLTWQWQPDASLNVQVAIDPKGQRDSTDHGILNRQTHEDFDSANAAGRPLPTLLTTDRFYDENGNLTSVTEHKLTSAGAAVEPTMRTYDRLDRLSTETRYDGKVLQYNYLPHGERLSVTDPDSNATSYTYDEQNRLKTATAESAVSTYAYYADGLQQSLALGNGVVDQRQYDVGGKLTQIITDKSEFDYTFDLNGNRTQQVERRTDAATQAPRASETTVYGYDTLDRLTGAAYSDHTLLYRLDAVGNRTGERQSSDALVVLGPAAFSAATHLTRDVTGTFDASDRLVSRTDALDASKNTALAYDLNGNLVSKSTTTNTRTFRWDARNTLTGVLDNGTELGRYDYRWDGLRVKRNAQSQQVEYVLDDKFVLAEGDGSVASHGTKRRYHYAAQPLAESEVSGASRFTTWLNTDAQGSVTDVTQLDGSLRTGRQYDAWGSYRNGTAPGSGDPKLGYTGHQFDPETSLTYARARYYDSDLGIFISRDPKEPGAGDAPWLHRYAYVRGNPGRYTDPDGLDVGAARALSTEDFLRESQNIDELNRFTSENPDPMAEADRIDKGQYGQVRVNPALGMAMTGSKAGAEFVVEKVPVVAIQALNLEIAIAGNVIGASLEAGREWAYDERVDPRRIVTAAETGGTFGAGLAALPAGVAAVAGTILGGVGIYEGGSAINQGWLENNPKKLAYGAATFSLGVLGAKQSAPELPELPELPSGWRAALQSLHHTMSPNERGMVDLGAFGRSSDGLPPGTLTAEKAKVLQAISNQYQTTIDVVGSRAQGLGRNIDNQALPVGKGPDARSDIDLRIDGQANIDSRGGLADALKEVSGGAGSIASELGTAHTKEPYIRFSPGAEGPSVVSKK